MIVRCLLFVMPIIISIMPAAFAAGLNVVVTLKPLHGLIADVMAGIGQPRLLTATGADPHSHALRPSEARVLANADVVFWVGPGLEGYLQKPLANLAGGARVLALNRIPGLRQLPARRGGIWSAHGGDAYGVDPHVWLDPRNAGAIARYAVTMLSELDPDHEDHYRRNGEAVLAQLNKLERDIYKLLTPVRALPYLVLHDAYQYFEARFRTNGIGAIAITPDRKPSARRISEIRQRLVQGKVHCLFRETNTDANIIETLTEGLDVRLATLDPIGRNITLGSHAYDRILRRLAGNLENCLSYSIRP